MKTWLIVLGIWAVVGCSGREDGPGGGTDAGARDAGGGTMDTGPALDTGPRADTGPASDSGAEDAGPRPRDAGPPGRDAGPPAGGPCSPGPCPPECFRPYRCVELCGGPAAECGCCPCAPGYIDDISC